MDLNTLCFIQFGVLFLGFILLEGFDYGVGIILPFWGKLDEERQALVDTLAPVWEGNEVWMVAAGAFLFAGFPEAYATLFSGMYLALLLVLLSLILRGVAFEFRDKKKDRKWRRFWDWSIFAGSLIPALIWGIAIANLLKGLPIDASLHYVGSFGDLLNMYTLASGIVFSLVFIIHGLSYLSLRLEKKCVEQMIPIVQVFCKSTVIGTAIFAIMTYVATDLSEKPAASTSMMLPVLFISLISVNYKSKRYTLVFFLSCGAVLSLMSAMFIGLYPRLMVSSLTPEGSLNIYNSASNPLTLQIISTTWLFVLPLIGMLEAWKFYVFRNRVVLEKSENASEERLRRLLKDFRILIRNAKCLSDILRSVSCSLRSPDGNVINRIKYSHKSMLFTGLPSKKIRRSISKVSRQAD